MKKWFIIYTATSLVSVFADCGVFIPSKIFYHDSGVAINYSFSEILNEKGYHEVDLENDADYILKLDAREIRGNLNRAQVSINFGNKLEVVNSKWCLTQMCSVYDYAQVIRKGMVLLSRSLNSCN